MAINITKPTVGGSIGVWGTQLNTALDDMVTEINRVGNLVGSGGSGTTGIPASTVTAKGDLLVATASGTVTRLGAGSNGQVLTADSTAGTGVAWKTPTTSGSGIAPGTLVLKATKTTSQTISGNTGQFVTFDQVNYVNTSAGFATAASGLSSYTPGIAGWYEVTGGVVFVQSTLGTMRSAYIVAGGQEVPGSVTTTVPGSSNYATSVPVRPSVIQLTAGQGIAIYAFHDVGAGMGTYYNQQWASTLNIKWLGAS